MCSSVCISSVLSLIHWSTLAGRAAEKKFYENKNMWTSWFKSIRRGKNTWRRSILKCDEVSRPLNEDEKKNHVLRIQCIIIAERWIKRWNSIIYLEIFLEAVVATADCWCCCCCDGGTGMVPSSCVQERRRVQIHRVHEKAKSTRIVRSTLLYLILLLLLLLFCVIHA